jgi:hypothetical protein
MSAARRVISTFIVSVSQTYLFSPFSDLGSRGFEFQKRGQRFIRVHNKAPTVVAVRVNDPDRSPLRING